MYRDGLLDPLCGLIMGETAENLVDMYDISREEQDEFALRVAAARRRPAPARRAAEMFPVEVDARGARRVTVAEDEHPRPDTTMDTLAKLAPVFREGGSVTAGNSSGHHRRRRRHGADERVARPRPRAASRSRAIIGDDAGRACPPRSWASGRCRPPRRSWSGPGCSLADIELIEINEAFAAQVIACERELKFDRDRLNVNGGGISVGHPIGMSGARIILSLAYEMRARDAVAGPGHALHLRRPGARRRPGTRLEESRPMSAVHAVVLIQCEIDEIPEAAQAIAEHRRRQRGLLGRRRVRPRRDRPRGGARRARHGDPRRHREGRGRRAHRDADRVPGLLEARPRAAVLDRVRRRLSRPFRSATCSSRRRPARSRPRAPCDPTC